MTMISEGIRRQDLNRLEEVLRSTGFFYEFEIRTVLDIAVESISEGMDKSGYYWLKITDGKKIIAFANYGKNALSTHSWELYWIAVHQDSRHMKLGSVLLKAIEENVIKAGGKILWIETSGRPLYAPTEGFYKRNGYELQASLKDFYGPGDPRQIYAKVLQ